MKRIFATLFASILLAGCQTLSGTNYGGSPSVNMSVPQIKRSEINFKNPNQKSWIPSLNRFSDQPNSQVFLCQGLACPAQSMILYQTIFMAKSITPDCGCALAIATELSKIYPKQGKIITKEPQLGSYKSFQTIFYSWTMTQDNKTTNSYVLWVFVGKNIIVLEGRTSNSFSQKAVEHFLSMIEISEENS